MDKVYKDVNNLEALLISCDTRGNASQKKGLVPWKDLFVRQSQNVSGSSFHRQRYNCKMQIFWASMTTEIESVSATDFVALTTLHSSFCFCLR